MSPSLRLQELGKGLLQAATLLNYAPIWIRTNSKEVDCPDKNCLPVFELPEGGVGVEPPNCFLNPLTHCQIMYWGVSYILYTCDLRHNFGWPSTIKKFNPLHQLIFLQLATLLGQ